MADDIDSLIDEHVSTPTGSTKPAVTETKSASAATATPVATQTPSNGTQPQTAAQKRLLKLKLDREERDFDVDDYWNDETKRTELQNTLQKGYMHETVLDRRIRERDEYILKCLKDQGIEWDADDTSPGGLRFRAKQVAAAVAAAQAVTSDPDAELEKRAREGDPAAIVDWNKRQFEKWKQEQEATKRAEVTAKQAEDAKKYGTFLTTAIADALKANAAAFDGPDGEELKRDVAALAWSAGWKPGATPQAAADVVAKFAQRVTGVAETRAKKILADTKPTTTPAPPVHGGAPATSRSNKTKNTDDLDALIEEHVGR